MWSLLKVGAERLIVSGCIVDEVEDDEALFAGSLSRAPAELLKVDHF